MLKPPSMDIEKWLQRASSKSIVTHLKKGQALEDFEAVIKAAARIENLDWVAAVAILHMVYGWMPTMLRPILPHNEKQRADLLYCLKKVRSGGELNTVELQTIARFANRSIVGASKLLHVLNPNAYVIWDSRVAKVFLWKTVTRAAYAKVVRFEEYLRIIRGWAIDPRVKTQCKFLKSLNTNLNGVSDLRIIELVLFGASSSARDSVPVT